MIAALAAAAGVYFTGGSLEATRIQTALAEQGQITDRYSKAVDQLDRAGTDHLQARLGGIYALERLAHDSPRDHPTILEVLTAFIRTTAHRSAITSSAIADCPGRDVAPDVQAALTVVGRRDIAHDQSTQIDLRNTCLRNADLMGADLRRADFNGADLQRTDLRYADLPDVALRAADLRDANLEGADLRNADLDGADLRSTVLNGTVLNGADLAGANLTRAYLFRADLTYANLRSAVLHTAFLTSADLYGADLRHADLSGADLRGALLVDVHLGGANLTSAASSNVG